MVLTGALNTAMTRATPSTASSSASERSPEGDGYLWASLLAIHHSLFSGLCLLLPVSLSHGDRGNTRTATSLYFPASPEVTLLRDRAAAAQSGQCVSRWNVTDGLSLSL